MLLTIDKNSFRDLISQGTQAKLQENPDAILCCAPETLPEKKPYRKRQSASDLAFQREMERLRVEGPSKHQDHEALAETSESRELSVEDFPGLLDATRRYRRR